MSVLIPEGFVLVPRGKDVAAKLLQAAAEVGADPITSVRTITGGYHVLEEVAVAYGAAHPAVEIVSEDPDGDPVEIVGEAVEDQGQEVTASATLVDGTVVTELPEVAEEAAPKSTRRTAAKK